MSIKSMRLKAEMTQLQLSFAMGVAQSTVSHWEIGLKKPSNYEVDRLAKILNCKVGDISGYDQKSD